VGTCAELLDLIFVLGDLVYGTIGLICELMVRVSTEPEGRRGVALHHQEGSSLFLSLLAKASSFNAFDSFIVKRF
jgi:hypothetical protein